MHFFFLVLSIWQTFIFLGWICISPWYPLILSNALSFFLTWLNTLFFMKCILLFLFLNLIEFCFWWIFIFVHPSQLEWSFMKSHVSCVFWWINILSKLDENSCIHFPLSLSLSFWLKSFLDWWPSLFSHSLMLSQNLISPWLDFLPF